MNTATAVGHRFGHARVSTSGQDLTTQLEKLKAVGIAEHDIEVDHGVSGRSLKRAGLTTLTGEWSDDFNSFIGGRMRRTDVLTVTTLDRLGRNAKEMLILSDRLKTSGMHLHILDLDIDTSTPSGQLLYLILAGIAEMEANIKAERARNGVELRRARGEKVGGRPKQHPDAPIKRMAIEVREGTVSASQAARDLGMSRTTFYARCKAMGLELRPTASPAE